MTNKGLTRVMIIIKLNGGLGNQMFQYALYQAFSCKGVDTKLDRSKYSHFDEKRTCILDYPCFQLDYQLCTGKEARQYVLGTGMLARGLVRLLGDKSTHIYEKAEYQYDETILELKEGYLDGFWQTWKYMDGIQNSIRDCFKFVGNMPQNAQQIRNMIHKTDSVAVHVRRGDYLKLKDIYGNICTEEYYKDALEEMKQMIDNPTFFFFSDDIEWVKNTFGTSEEYIYADGSNRWEDYHDMQLMSECKHMIMANSSFSWWAAFLNQNEGKKIICPNQWINSSEDTSDVYCKEWIKE